MEREQRRVEETNEERRKATEKEEKDGEGDGKECSELSTNQQDSAYSSLKHSAYSSLDPIRTQKTSGCTGTSCAIKSTTSTSNRGETTSKSSGSSNLSAAILSATQNISQNATLAENKENSDRPTRKRKPKICQSPKERERGKYIVEQSQTSFASAKESKAAKVATLSQALGYVDQFRKTQASKNDKRRGPDESDINELAFNLLHASQGAGLTGFLPDVSEESEEVVEDVTNLKNTSRDGNGFCVAVSMHDGMVVQTTASINHVLGYPKDMWVGRNFIDFVHPMDRDTFINQVTENLGLILRDIHSSQQANWKDTYCKSGSFFCRIRIYNGLKSGFTVKDRKTRFAPFKLSVCFLEMDCKSPTNQTQSSNSNSGVGPQSTYLFITAIPLVSAFSLPYEDFTFMRESDPQPVFVTKHNSNYKFSNIEESVIPYLGFLPQDMNGEDIFSFVHPDDQNTLKDVFSNAMLELGRPCKSKYIRLRVRNGGYVYVNSWWSFFINPWSRQLEFVHGKHTVKKGPRHPDVYADVTKDVPDIEVIGLKKSQNFSATDPNNTQSAGTRNIKDMTATETSSKARRELSSFMVTLLEVVAKSEKKTVGNLGKVGTVVNVIGNISPHQSDSSETPPSYNQLSYNENLTRFFNSQPKTLTDKEIIDNGSNRQSKNSDESGHNKSNDSKNKNSEEDAVRSAQGSGGSGYQTHTISGSGEDNGKNSSTMQTGLSAGQVQSGRDECMMSQDGSGSGSRYGSGSRGASVDTFPAPELTVDLLARHNKEMEAKMLSKYKESKKTGEIRFIRDHKYNMAQQETINRLGVQKGLQNELSKGKRRCNTKTTKPMQAPLDPGDREAQNVNTMWRQYVGADGQNQPKFVDASKMKHAHEGFVGFNQANMMERGVPSTMSAFPNLVEVPTFYMAFRANQNNASQKLMQSGLLMHGRSPGYIGLDPSSSSYRLGDRQEGESLPSGSKLPQVRKRSPIPDPELPNCLAVSSCMVCRPESGNTVPTGSKCNKKIIRPHSRTGSRATSIKGEPGSALESSASVSVKEKNLYQAKELSTVVDQYQHCQSTTSSSSLYSFLKTSDDYSFTNPNSSDGETKAQMKYHVAKPVLSEPFWNERVVLTNELIYNYQLDIKDRDAVLKADLKILNSTGQYKDVCDQLLEANCPLEDAQTLINSRSTVSSDDSTSEQDSDDDSDSVEVTIKHQKKKDNLEKQNIFMEAEAPFPLQETSKLMISTENFKIFRSPEYSSESTSERKRSFDPLRSKSTSQDTGSGSCSLDKHSTGSSDVEKKEGSKESEEDPERESSPVVEKQSNMPTAAKSPQKSDVMDVSVSMSSPAEADVTMQSLDNSSVHQQISHDAESTKVDAGKDATDSVSDDHSEQEVQKVSIQDLDSVTEGPKEDSSVVEGPKQDPSNVEGPKPEQTVIDGPQPLNEVESLKLDPSEVQGSKQDPSVVEGPSGTNVDDGGKCSIGPDSDNSDL